MIFNDLYWREPLWLLLSLAPILLVWFILYRQRNRLSRLIDDDLLPWSKGTSKYNANILVRSLMLLAWLFFCVALSGPRTPSYVPDLLQAKSDVLIAVIDFSASMNAKDSSQHQNKETRIIAAKKLLQHWMNQMPVSMNMGVIIYAGHTHWVIKPTNDHKLLKHYLENIEKLKPPTMGNELSGAIALAMTELIQYKGRRNLVLLTDGDFDDQARQNARAEIGASIETNSVKLNIIGVGAVESSRVTTLSGESLIIDGKTVISRLESQWLKKLGEMKHVSYHYIDNPSVLKFADFFAVTQPRINPENYSQIVWDEWFAIPLILGVLLLLSVLQSQASRQIEE